MAGDCGCSRVWRVELTNGTCGNCGGWLPGERPTSLPWTQDEAKAAGRRAVEKHADALRRLADG